MNYDQIVNKLTSTSFFSSFAGLYRMKKTMDHFGNPEAILPTIHVAGTNGKGSVCAMLHDILKAAGYKVGLFTSPYLHCIRERIRINGDMISEEAMARIGTTVCNYCDKLYEPPNQFELLTIMAFLYFVEEHCDIVVLETGLGGTFDPTNIVPNPLASVIMNIGPDHCKILGDTIPKIAAAKAGIIKKRCDVVIYPSDQKAVDVITAVALQQDAKPHLVEKEHIKALPPVPGYEHFSYKGIELYLNLLGEHQRYNCAVALEVIRLLNLRNYFISEEDMKAALKHVDWPGRMELLRSAPDVYLDGGHNPQCMEAAATFFRSERFSGRKLHIFAGFVADKEYETMLLQLKELSSDILLYRFAHPRGLSEEECHRLCEAHGLTLVENATDALTKLVSTCHNEDVILCIGSLYMADEIRSIFKKNQTKNDELT